MNGKRREEFETASLIELTVEKFSGPGGVSLKELTTLSCKELDDLVECRLDSSLQAKEGVLFASGDRFWRTTLTKRPRILLKLNARLSIWACSAAFANRSRRASKIVISSSGRPGVPSTSPIGCNKVSLATMKAAASGKVAANRGRADVAESSLSVTAG